ncbi:MAG: hypothetical protein O3A46_06815 [Candidatus Poribacteria bacterium]|nr:hypothetical protein [Candidatus Poribacteria bacterium]
MTTSISLERISPTTKRRFEVLAKRWKSQAELMSSSRKMAEIPEYGEIIALGDDAIRLILDELRREPHFWFIALERLTKRDDIVPTEHKGDIDAMAKDWVRWGEREGFIL